MMFPVKFAEQAEEPRERSSAETTEGNKSSERGWRATPQILAGIMNVGELKASLKTSALLVAQDASLFSMISRYTTGAASILRDVLCESHNE